MGMDKGKRCIGNGVQIEWAYCPALSLIMTWLGRKIGRENMHGMTH